MQRQGGLRCFGENCSPASRASALLCFGGSGRGAAGVAEQDHPARRALSAGGNADLLGRLIGPKLSEAFGQPVIIDNKAGAGGAIGAAEAAHPIPTAIPCSSATSRPMPSIRPSKTSCPTGRSRSSPGDPPDLGLAAARGQSQDRSEGSAGLIALAKAQPGTASLCLRRERHAAAAGLRVSQGEDRRSRRPMCPARARHPRINDSMGGHGRRDDRRHGRAMARKDGALRALAVHRPATLEGAARRADRQRGRPCPATSSRPGTGYSCPPARRSEIVERLNAE